MMPAPDAFATPLTLSFSTGVLNSTSVVFHPGFQKYYIIRAGNSLFPLETLSSNGAQLYQTTAGLDTRGMWWNPINAQVERNQFSSGGWATVNLNPSGLAMNTYTAIYTGQLQPNAQSVGAFDYNNNRVIYYTGGNQIYFYDRVTGLPSGTLTLSGTSFSNLNVNSVIYTGQTGFEVGLLNYAEKRVLLFNISTGAFTGASQLPSNSPAYSQFRFSYANDMVWLFNASSATWHSYYIWNLILPDVRLDFEAVLSPDESVGLVWKMNNQPDNIADFTLERAYPDEEFREINKQSPDVSGEYLFTDEEVVEGKSEYRVKMNYLNGQHHYSEVRVITRSASQMPWVSVYPNPASSEIIIRSSLNTTGNYLLFNAEGKKVMEIPASDKLTIKTDISFLSPGIYTLKSGAKSLKIIKE